MKYYNFFFNFFCGNSKNRHVKCRFHEFFNDDIHPSSSATEDQDVENYIPKPTDKFMPQINFDILRVQLKIS